MFGVRGDGACEECKALDGKVFNSADEVPDRPHPNCKCSLNVVENISQDDPIGAYRLEKREQQELSLKLAKMAGDARTLEDEIDEYIRRVEEQGREIERAGSEISGAQLKNEVSALKEKVDAARSQGEKAKAEVGAFKRKVAASRGSIQEISKLQFELQKLNEYKEKMIIDAKLNIFTLGISSMGLKQPDAASLWNISFKGLQYDDKYIRENGKIINTIADLNNHKLEKLVQQKIQAQMGIKDSRGIIFHKDSSLAIAVKNSDELKKFIRDNKNTLIKTGKLANKSLSFLSGNLKNALHNVDIIDTWIDAEGVLHSKILDTYDFNPNETDWKVQTAREMQEKKKIQTYYTITEIILPKKVWMSY